MKTNNPKLSVIIPVYNEENTIQEIINRVSRVNIKKEIIIVDDFSTDGTREILNKLKANNIKVIFHDKNYGKGYAIRTAIKHITGNITIIQDADLEYSPEDYLKLIEPIANNRASVVYGTRFPKDAKRPSLFNRFFLANRILTSTANILYKAEITDEPTCYKVFDSNILKSLDLKCTRFEFCPEVTAKVRKIDQKIYELPILYNPRSIEEGKKIKLKDGFEALWTLIKYKFID